MAESFIILTRRFAGGQKKLKRRYKNVQTLVVEKGRENMCGGGIR